MNPDEKQVRRRLTLQWIEKAESDLEAAEYLLSRKPPLFYQACFFSQQSAEKFLKGLLTHKQIEFRKTHDLGELLDLVARFDEALAAKLSFATKLNPYGVDIRYPGEMPEPDSGESEMALRCAQKVRDAVIDVLRADDVIYI